MFLKALECEQDVKPKAMINLGLLYNTRGNMLAQTGDYSGSKEAALEGRKHLDAAKPLLEAMKAAGQLDDDLGQYLRQHRPLRLQNHRLLGQLLAATGDLAACESEFRLATESFPDEPGAWQMLSKVLEAQGKTAEAQGLVEKINRLLASR